LSVPCKDTGIVSDFPPIPLIVIRIFQMIHSLAPSIIFLVKAFLHRSLS
jgi:hypothetical protein